LVRAGECTTRRVLSRRLDLSCQLERAAAARRRGAACAKPAAQRQQSRDFQSARAASRSLHRLLVARPGEPRRRNGLASADLSRCARAVSVSGTHAAQRSANRRHRWPARRHRKNARRARDGQRSLERCRERYARRHSKIDSRFCNARPNVDRRPGGLLGAIARLPSASAVSNAPPTDVAARRVLGSIANSQEANSLSPYQPQLSDVGNVPADDVDPPGLLQASANGATDLGVPLNSLEGPPAFLFPPSFRPDGSNSEGTPTATDAIYLYPSPLDQILPCLASGVGCAGGGGGNRGGGGGGSAGPRPSPPSAPAPGPRPSSPSARGTPQPSAGPVDEQPRPVEPGTRARDVPPRAPINDESTTTPSDALGLRPSVPLAEPPVEIVSPEGFTPLEQLPPGSAGGVNEGRGFVRPDPYPEGTPCTYCKQPTTNQIGRPNSLERDHNIPRSRGGNGSRDNKLPACRTCNRQKGSRTPEEWYRWLLQR
jgi:hypothetical protein